MLGIVFNVLYAQFYKKPLVHSCFLDLQPAVLGRHILFFPNSFPRYYVMAILVAGWFKSQNTQLRDFEPISEELAVFLGNL